MCEVILFYKKFFENLAIQSVAHVSGISQTPSKHAESESAFLKKSPRDYFSLLIILLLFSFTILFQALFSSYT